MKAFALLRASALLLAALGLIVPPAALASRGQGPAIDDVQLHAGGALIGQLVTPEGQGVPGQLVSLTQGDRQVALSKSDENGYYTIRGLRGGTYQIATAGGAGVFRAWSEGTAPPTAQSGALIVVGDGAVRGNYGYGAVDGQYSPVAQFLSNPWVVAGLLGAAIAVPIAIANHDSGS